MIYFLFLKKIALFGGFLCDVTEISFYNLQKYVTEPFYFFFLYLQIPLRPDANENNLRSRAAGFEER
jgi:hypothetical protein